MLTKVLSFIGYCTSSSKTHFFAGKLFKNKSGKERIYVYDAQKNHFKRTGSTRRKAWGYEKAKFDLDGLVGFSVMSQT